MMHTEEVDYGEEEQQLDKKKTMETFVRLPEMPPRPVGILPIVS